MHKMANYALMRRPRGSPRKRTTRLKKRKPRGWRGDRRGHRDAARLGQWRRWRRQQLSFMAPGAKSSYQAKVSLREEPIDTLAWKAKRRNKLKRMLKRSTTPDAEQFLRHVELLERAAKRKKREQQRMHDSAKYGFREV